MIREILNGLGRMTKFLNWLLDHITYIFLVISGVTILLMALFTSYGVVRRYVFGSPDSYVYLISAILMLGCAMFSFAHIQRLKRQITVDYLRRYFPPAVREFIINVVGPILGLVFLVLIVWMTWDDAMFAMQAEQRVMHQSQIVTYPLKLVVPFGAGLLCLVLIAQMLRYLASFGGKSDKAKG